MHLGNTGFLLPLETDKLEPSPRGTALILHFSMTNANSRAGTRLVRRELSLPKSFVCQFNRSRELWADNRNYIKSNLPQTDLAKSVGSFRLILTPKLLTQLLCMCGGFNGELCQNLLFHFPLKFAELLCALQLFCVSAYLRLELNKVSMEASLVYFFYWPVLSTYGFPLYYIA